MVRCSKSHGKLKKRSSKKTFFYIKKNNIYPKNCFLDIIFVPGRILSEKERSIIPFAILLSPETGLANGESWGQLEYKVPKGEKQVRVNLQQFFCCISCLRGCQIVLGLLRVKTLAIFPLNMTTLCLTLRMLQRFLDYRIFKRIVIIGNDFIVPILLQLGIRKICGWHFQRNLTKHYCRSTQC